MRPGRAARAGFIRWICTLGCWWKLRDLYEVRSNRESGYGRYDVILIPRNLDRDAMILEFKVKETEEKTLQGNGTKSTGDRLK